MAARGLLENPALFNGYDMTPPEVVSEWTTLALNYGVPTHIYHQHLMMMLYKVHNKEGKHVLFVVLMSQRSDSLTLWNPYPPFWTTCPWQVMNWKQIVPDFTLNCLRCFESLYFASTPIKLVITSCPLKLTNSKILLGWVWQEDVWD